MRNSPPSAEKISFFRPSYLDGVEILSADHCDRIWRVYHETYTVCTVLGKSRTTWTYRKSLHEAKYGQLMLMEPGELHFNHKIHGDGTFRVIYFPVSLIASMASEAGIQRTIHWSLADVSQASIFHTFVHLHRSIERGATLLEQQSRLTQCLDMLVKYCAENRLSPTAKPSVESLKKVKFFMYENWQRNVGLQELAEVAGLSRFHFLRAFTATFGAPPHVYQTHMRIAKAQVLLAKGVPEPHLQLGFADQSHFIRHFKRAMGVTPGQYAAMVRKPFSGALV